MFRMEPAWAPLQVLSRGVSGDLAARCCPEVRDEPLVFLAMTVKMMGWKSACGLLQHFQRRLLHRLVGATATWHRDLQRHRHSAVLGTTHPKIGVPFTWTVSPTRNCSTGTTSATLLVIPLIQALLNVWNEWCIPCQTTKQVQRSVEGEALGVPIDGTSGVIAPPRDQVADLTCLTMVFAGKCVTVFQIRRQASCVFPINVDLDAAAGDE